MEEKHMTEREAYGVVWQKKDPPEDLGWEVDWYYESKRPYHGLVLIACGQTEKSIGGIRRPAVGSPLYQVANPFRPVSFFWAAVAACELARDPLRRIEIGLRPIVDNEITDLLLRITSLCAAEGVKDIHQIKDLALQALDWQIESIN